MPYGSRHSVPSERVIALRRFSEKKSRSIWWVILKTTNSSPCGGEEFLFLQFTWTCRASRALWWGLSSTSRGDQKCESVFAS